jgi:hypothetical protein
VQAVRTDVALTWRIATFFPDEAAVSAALDESITRWEASFTQHVAAAPFDLEARGVSTNVRFVASPVSDGAYFAFIPDPARPAYFQRGYRALWNTPEVRAYFIANDIRPYNCSINYNTVDPGSEPLTFFCRDVTATVDALTETVISYELGT